MANFLLIGICIGLGMLLRWRHLVPTDAHKGINAWIIWLALPAVSFKYLPHIVWTSDLLLPAIAPVIVWLCAWVYVTIYARFNSLPKPERGALKLSSGLSNTSFVGFPLVTAWFSESDIGTAVICDQVTFMLMATAGVIVAMNSSENHVLKPGMLIKKLFSFPPFLGCLLALTLPRFIDISPLDPLFDKLAGTIGPLALFSIGLQLQFTGWRRELKHITAALFYKLIIAPFIILAVVLLLGMSGRISQITVFEMAMPTLLSSGIVAAQYNLRPGLCNLIIGIGILLSFATTAAWYFIITALI